MKWSLEKPGNDVFLTVNGKRGLSASGKENILEVAKPGKNKDSVWIRFKGDRNGVQMDRSSFEAGNGQLSEKFRNVKTNAEFLDILKGAGVKVLSKESEGVKKKDTVIYPDKQPIPSSGQPDKEFETILAKSNGKKKVNVDQLVVAPSEMQIRDINVAWVQRIKAQLKDNPYGIPTTIPVLLQPETKMFNEKDQRFVILGGNHLVAAMKLALTEEPENLKYECLRTVDADVYYDLTVREAQYIAAMHNNKCSQRRMFFQDKVRVARKCCLSQDERWQDEAIKTLSYLDGKKYTRDCLGTVLSVANYSQENWTIVEDIFMCYEGAADSEIAFPQKLFKELQGVKDMKRTPYLSRAVGTNGLKVAQMVDKDKRRENMKEMAMSLMEESEWEATKLKYKTADKWLEYTGNLSTLEGRRRFSNFVKNMEMDEDRVEHERGVEVKIYKNGIDVTHKYEAITEKYIKKIKTDLNKIHTEE